MRSTFRALTLAIAAFALLGMAQTASAIQILAMSQTSGSNTVTATTINGNTQTQITGTDIAVLISQIDAANPTPINAFLNLNVTSFGNAVNLIGSLWAEEFAGGFQITSGAGGTGTNYLSGTFTDAGGGAVGGTGFILSFNEPPDTVSFTSDVITGLIVPRTGSFSFSNLTPPLSIFSPSLGVNTFGNFTAAVTGTFSDGETPNDVVPEPASMLLLGTGLVGLGARLRRRTKKA